MNYIWLNPVPFLAKVGNAIYPKNELTQRRSLNLIPDFLINSIGFFFYSLDCPFREQVHSGKTYRLVQDVFNQLVKAAKERCPSSKNNRWEIRIQYNSEVNACCLPGGKVIITTGMLRKLKEEETKEVSQKDLVASVLGHEISHALAEHSRLKLQLFFIINIIGYVAARILFPIFVPISTKMRKWAYNHIKGVSLLYIFAKHSQACELEADAFGIKLASQAHYNPKGAIKLHEMFLKIDKESYWFERLFRFPSFLSSHPSSHKRIEENQKTINDLTSLKTSHTKIKNTNKKKEGAIETSRLRPTAFDVGIDYFIFFLAVFNLMGKYILKNGRL